MFSQRGRDRKGGKKRQGVEGIRLRPTSCNYAGTGKDERRGKRRNHGFTPMGTDGVGGSMAEDGEVEVVGVSATSSRWPTEEL